MVKSNFESGFRGALLRAMNFALRARWTAFLSTARSSALGNFRGTVAVKCGAKTAFQQVLVVSCLLKAVGRHSEFGVVCRGALWR
jgi:hypothetical protein